jgi:hypothetical protein
MRRSSLRWFAAAAACAFATAVAGVPAAAHEGSERGSRSGVRPAQRAAAARVQARNGVDPGPTPRASCGPGSHPETGMQGRVSAEDTASGRAAARVPRGDAALLSAASPSARGDGRGTPLL